MYHFPLKFHKKITQLQVDLSKPKEVTLGDKVKKIEGCLFLSIVKAKTDGSDRMDWDNEIKIKLAANDITEIITRIRANQTAKLYHSNQKTQVITTLEVAAGDKPGTYKWFISKTQNNNKQYGNIYLDQKDMYYLFLMFEAALPIIAGWT